MMRHWSFYDPATGEISPQGYAAPNAKDLERNTPAGLVAIAGRLDAATQRVETDGSVVAWHNAKLVDARASSERSNHAMARLAELERRQHRRVREILAASDPQLQAIEAEAAELRQVIAGKDTSGRSG